MLISLLPLNYNLRNQRWPVTSRISHCTICYLLTEGVVQLCHRWWASGLRRQTPYTSTHWETCNMPAFLVQALFQGTIVGSTSIKLLSLKVPVCACIPNQVVKQSLLCAFMTGSNNDRWHSVWHQRGQGKWRQGERYKADWESMVFGGQCMNTDPFWVGCPYWRLALVTRIT